MEQENKTSLYKKILAVMGKVERVPKNGYNSFHKYQFVQESDLVDHVRKFMTEEGLVLFNDVISYEVNADIATVKINFTICCTETGASTTTSIIAEGQDKGDKKFYKAMAGATKYYLMKTFLIPTGDDPENDEQPKKQQKQTQQRQPQQQPQQTQSKPPVSDHYQPKLISPNQLKLLKTLITKMEKAYSITSDEVKAMLEKTNGVGKFASSKDLTIGQASAAIKALQTQLGEG